MNFILILLITVATSLSSDNFRHIENVLRSFVAQSSAAPCGAEVAKDSSECGASHSTDTYVVGSLEDRANQLLNRLREINTKATTPPDPAFDRNWVVANQAPTIVTIYNFITPQEADYLIAQAEPKLNRSDTGTYSFAILDSAVASQFFARASAATVLPISHIEPIQLFKYSPGDFEPAHVDILDAELAMGTGGQRSHTILVHLNDVTDEGAFNFPNINLSFQPTKGTAVLWNNLDGHWRPDARVTHESKPSSAQTKYTLKIYLREAAFGEDIRPKANGSSVVDYGFGPATIISSDPKILLLDNFLSDKECDHVVKLIDERMERSKVLTEEGVHEARTSWSGSFEKTEDDVIQKIELRAGALTVTPGTYIERLQVVRYFPGQFYKEHFDFFEKDSAGYEEAMENGGQRKFTILVYLNNVEEGGETDFPVLGTQVTPKKGAAVIWPDVDGEGKVDRRTLHAGKPPTKGIKYAMNIWIREHLIEPTVHNPPQAHPEITSLIDPKMTIMSMDPMIVLIHNFITLEEAEFIIRAGEPLLKKSLVAGGKPHPGRTSSSVFLPSSESDVYRAITERAGHLFYLPESHVEPIELVRYKPGEFYRDHSDCFQPGSDGYDNAVSIGGQRKHSLIVYLSTLGPDDGGKDRFTQLNFNVQPTLGAAVMWSNVLGTGDVDSRVRMECLAPTAGVKYVLNIRIREKPFSR